MEKIHILIVDDHAIVRKGLAALISNQPDMEVVGEAPDGTAAVRLADELQPDVVLMDLVMPRLDGIGATLEIKRRSPRTRILVLSSFGEDEKLFPAIKAGASGYLLKDTLPQELLQAILDVQGGRPSLHPAIAARLMQELQGQPVEMPGVEPLTGREVDVLKLVAHGLTNGEIAQQMVLSERTVCAHVSNILDKLHLANRTQAALYALREGLTGLYE